MAIPLTPAALRTATARGDALGFATQIGKWENYQPFVDLAHDTIRDARRAGITVVLDATMDAWGAALTAFEVVTLVAHWRSSAVAAEDIREWNQVLEAATVRTSPLRQVLASLDRASCEPAAYDRASLARWLNGVPMPLLDASPDAGRVDEEYRLYRRRQEIERALPGAVGGGPAIEFGDGFHPVPQVLNRIDASIATVIDLTVCNSVLLGEEIRRKCRDCVVMMNSRQVEPGFRLALYRQVIALMVKRGRSFPDTMMQLRQFLRDPVA